MIRTLLQSLFLSLFLSTSLSAAAITLASQFERAEAGDYVVFCEQKQVTVLRIAGVENHILYIEEISAPESAINPKELAIEGSWQEWLMRDAPGHSSWTISSLDLATGKLISSYSVETNQWLSDSPFLSFLPTLLALELEEVPPTDRKKTGPAPREGSPDFRKIWNPRATVNGQVVTPQPPFVVLRVKWPENSGDLSGKLVTLYLPQDINEAISFEGLTYFPYWIEVQGYVGRAKLIVIDSGKRLISPVNYSVVNKNPESEN